MADVLVETLVAFGITHVFGMVGHSNLGFADAMRRAEERGQLTYIGIRHEGRRPSRPVRTASSPAGPRPVSRSRDRGRPTVAANALRSAVGERGTVLGPPLAGLLFAVSGTRLVLGLDALTFLAAVPLALRLPALAQDNGGQSRPSFVRDARDGLAFIRHMPYVLAVAVGFWVVVLFSAPDDLILPFLATQTFRAGPVAVGVLLAAASAGLLAGLPLTGPAGRRLGVTRAIVAGFAVMAAGNLLTAAAPLLMAAFAAQVLRGLAIPLADAHVTTHLQRTTPPQMLGRVLANVYGGVGAAAAAGYLIGGPVLAATSPRTAFVIVGCGALAGAAVTAVLLRNARRQPGTE